MILIALSDMLSPFAQHFLDNRRVDHALERQIRFALLIEHGLDRVGERPRIVDQQLGVDGVGFDRDLFVQPKKILQKGHDLGFLAFDPAQGVQLGADHSLHLFALQLDFSRRSADADGRHVEHVGRRA